MTILRTERLILRPVQREDMPLFEAFYGDPAVMSVRKYGVLDPETAREHVEIMLQHWQARGFGMWVVLDAADKAFAGECGLRWQDDSGEIELSYGLSPRFRGRGLATEAAQAVIDHAREDLKLERVVAIARNNNHVSHRILEKLGMKLISREVFGRSDLVKYLLPREGEAKA